MFRGEDDARPDLRAADLVAADQVVDRPDADPQQLGRFLLVEADRPNRDQAGSLDPGRVRLPAIFVRRAIQMHRPAIEIAAKRDAISNDLAAEIAAGSGDLGLP